MISYLIGMLIFACVLGLIVEGIIELTGRKYRKKY